MALFGLLGPKTKRVAPGIRISGMSLLPPLDVEGALRIAAVFDAVRIISEDVASLPLHVYDGKGASRSKVEYLRLSELLHDAPNDYQTAMDFREALTASLLIAGHGYAEIERMQSGEIAALHFIDPYRVAIQTTDGRLRFSIDGKPFPSKDIFHLHGFSTDGIHARAIAQQACDSLELSRSLDIYGREFFRKGGNLKAVLKSDRKLSDEARERLREGFRLLYSNGPAAGNSVAVLEDGIDYHQLTSKPEESQLLELRRFQVNEVARWFRLPPHMLGDLERATHSNIEQQAIEYVRYSLRPWLIRWEQAIKRQLLDGDRYAEHNVEGLLRGDIKSRYEAYSIGRQWGWLSTNDIRTKENLPPISGGDEYLVPLNMQRMKEGSDDSAVNFV